jgi:hypothetical protein
VLGRPAASWADGVPLSGHMECKNCGLVRQYAIACGVALGIEVLLFMMRPPFDEAPLLHNVLGYPLLPGLFVASLLSLEGTDLSSVAVWLVFALGINAMLYGALLLLCWRRWGRARHQVATSRDL